jgi:hypothetical protein
MLIPLTSTNEINNTIDEDGSIDSNFDPETPTIADGSIDSAYDAATIRSEFKTYQSILPKPDELLQGKHSFTFLRNLIKENNIELPRFLKYKFEGGIKPHHALCCLLLSEYEAELHKEKDRELGKKRRLYPSLVRIISFGYLHSQLNNPSEFIRDQFDRVAPVVPTAMVKPSILRKKIKDRGLPVPNYFLDPEDSRQFPPHIALLVILQDGEKESRKLDSFLNRFAFSVLAFIALLLRVVLEVIGAAGAIWGGSEVVKLRTADNKELWRWISIVIGILSFFRFITLHIPQKEDEGDILGPAGPWSLRLPVRLRAVTEHPFHYFVRALPPSSPRKKKE